MAKPAPSTKPGTLHVLYNRHGEREAVFEWDGSAWSTPGTGWSTRPSGMSTLGWSYRRPKEDHQSPSKDQAA